MKSYIFLILIVAYSGHIMEEYILDWKKWVLKVSRISVSWNDFYITNIAVIILGFCCAEIGSENIYISLLFPSLMLINSFVHIVPTMRFRIFSPGIITSILLFIPLSLITFYLFRDLLNIKVLIFEIIGSCIIMIFPVLLQLLKIRITANE
jgi:hypothetical protein